MHFLLRARAVAVFPGGYGTFDEMFELLTLIQTGKVRPLPILLFGKDYWNRVVNFEAMVEEGVIAPHDLELIHWTEDAQRSVGVRDELLRRSSAPRCRGSRRRRSERVRRLGLLGRGRWPVAGVAAVVCGDCRRPGRQRRLVLRLLRPLLGPLPGGLLWRARRRLGGRRCGQRLGRIAVLS